jgi:hypothetical protein
MAQFYSNLKFLRYVDHISLFVKPCALSCARVDYVSH